MHYLRTLTYFLDLALIQLIDSCLADSDLFSYFDEFTGSLPSISGDPLFAEDNSENESLFTDPSETLWNDYMSSSCIDDDDQEQSSKLRARNPVCPIVPLNPHWPDLTDVENAVQAERTRPDPPYYVTVRVNGRSITAEEPEFHCHFDDNYGDLGDFGLYPYGIPVCALSSDRRVIDKSDLSWHIPIEYTVEPSTLLVPGPWQCPESQFYCCFFWHPYLPAEQVSALEEEGVETVDMEYPELLARFSSFAIGIGDGCINMKESDWRGYNAFKNSLPFNMDDLEM